MAKENGKATLTEYVVLQATAVKVEKDTRTAWLPVLKPDGEVRIFTAAGKLPAIRQYTGDGSNVIEGRWKAIPVSSWRGGEETKRTMMAERLPLEL